jgi:hypothetical protein
LKAENIPVPSIANIIGIKIKLAIAVKTAYKFWASMFSPIFFPDIVFLERTPRAEDETFESMAEARARTVKESSFMEAMATPPMIGSKVR